MGFQGVFTGRVGSRQKVLIKLTGRVGSGEEAFDLSRIGSGQDVFKYDTLVRLTLT